MVKIDIEMPTYCYDCPCHNGENGRCNITGDSVFDKRPFDCPLKEVKHGKWVHLGGDEWCCSVCGEVIFTEGSWEKPDKKYCNECGAKMDGKEENEK